jgi:uncharacterized iron-regulated membrane protein
MNIAKVSSWLHKWLALIIGVQVLLWIVSGAFFAIYPIERVRSEHRIAEQQHAPLDPASLASPAEIAALLQTQPMRITYERGVRGEAIAVAEFHEGAPVLIDAAARRVLSPLDEATAREIASVYVANAPPIRSARLVTEGNPEYRGQLPAWRIDFEDREGLAVYVAADTGRVGARRSDLWRVYDALWALHIMDWRDHENFNTGLLIVASVASLIMALFGIILIPYRFGWLRRRAS